MNALVRFEKAGLHPLWSDLNFQVHSGEFCTIIGNNGVGKSSLLQTIIGQRALSSGSVQVKGRIGYIPQHRTFGPEGVLRAYDLVSLSLAHGVIKNRRVSKQVVQQALADADALEFSTRRVNVLSGGQQQRIRQAQAFANKPEILLCDEPLLSLDVEQQIASVERIRRYQQQTGAAVIFVTHSLRPVLEITDQLLLLRSQDSLLGKPEEVLAQVATPYLSWEGGVI